MRNKANNPVPMAVAVEPSAASEFHAAAQALAARLSLPLAELGAPGFALFLVLTSERLELREPAPSRTGPVFVDFVGGAVGRRMWDTGLGRQPLLRAVGFKRGQPPTVLDATAGLGRDAFLMAAAGCRVMAVERRPVMAALLADGLRRALLEPRTAEAAARCVLVEADAGQVMEGFDDEVRPDVVYLDPMFAARAKTAASKKELRLCGLACGADHDADDLLEPALKAARKRVVVKRWLHAPVLAERRPHASIKGASIRFDIYTTS